MEIKTIELGGLVSALRALRLPHNLGTRSEVDTEVVHTNVGSHYVRTGSTAFVHPKDLTLMQALQRKGDQHAKALRGIVVWAEIKAPLYWFVEEETYVVGHQRLCSTSTMHTEGKGLSGEALQKVKAEIPMGREMTKIDYFSYPTLRRMVFQRHNHRLPEWQTFCEWVKTLPLAEELIFNGLDDLDNGDPSL